MSVRRSRTVDAEVQVPPSKSYTNRALIASSLAEGTSTILNPSSSDDSEYLIRALHKFGIKIQRGENCLHIEGSAGNLCAPSEEIFIGNAGTSMRFLTAFSSLAQGETVLTGDEQMQKRPIGDLLESLHSAGVQCSSNKGFPPVKILGGKLSGGTIDIKGSVSSQFVSSMMLVSPYARHPATLIIKGKLTSRPYIDMTLHVMRSFGAMVETLDPSVYSVSNTERYIGQPYQVEGDASSATYFLAAAAITGGRILITNLTTESLQGDIKFLQILSDMGCTIISHEQSIELHGGKLFGIEVDMNDLPDCVPTLAVMAAFAKGPTTIHNIAHLRFKETDRLSALAKELTKLGVNVEIDEDALTIHPEPLHRAEIETYNDHRIAMSFAIAGLRIPQLTIANPGCVSKSFPNFWDEFSKLEEKV